MSRALMSSRAVTAVFWILLRRIRERAIELVAVNIGQNGGGKQTAYRGDAFRAARELRAYRRRGNVVRRDRLRDDRAGHSFGKNCRVAGVAGRPFIGKSAVERPVEGN